MVLITNVHNNGDGTYTLTFSAPVTNSYGGVYDEELNLLALSDSGGGWNSMEWLSQTDPTHITYADGTSATDCTILAFINQPQHLSATEPFAAATPTPVT